MTCVKEIVRFALNQGATWQKRRIDDVRTFIFRCPTTGYNVQGHYEENGSPLPAFVGQYCLACSGLHIVDPLTGKGVSELSTVATAPCGSPSSSD